MHRIDSERRARGLHHLSVLMAFQACHALEGPRRVSPIQIQIEMRCDTIEENPRNNKLRGSLIWAKSGTRRLLFGQIFQIQKESRKGYLLHPYLNFAHSRHFIWVDTGIS